MNLSVEFHDSELAEATVLPQALRLLLRPAMLHSSPGRAGIDSGSVYSAAVELLLAQPTVLTGAIGSLGKLSDGALELDGEAHTVVPLPFNFAGPIRVWFELATGEQIEINATALQLNVLDQGAHLDEFVV